MSIFSTPDPSREVTDAALNYFSSTTYRQKVYTLGLEQLDASDSLDERNASGWRFLIDIAPDLAVAVDVKQTAPNEPPSLSGVIYGPHAAKAVRAAENIEDHIETSNQVPDGDYALTRLWIPGLLIDAFWVKGAAGEWIVPYDASTPGLTVHTVYSKDAFMNVVRPLAKKTLADLYSLPHPPSRSH